MRQKSGPVKELAEKVVKDIHRATRRHFSAEDKIRIVLEGLRGKECIVELMAADRWQGAATPSESRHDRVSSVRSLFELGDVA